MTLLAESGRIGNHLFQSRINFDIIVDGERLSSEKEAWYRDQLPSLSDERISEIAQGFADAKRQSAKIQKWNVENPYIPGGEETLGVSPN